MQKNKVISFLILYINFGIYSLSTLFSKFASQYAFASIEFIALYASSILFLFVYAVLWQQVLKRFALSFAYANRAIIIPLGMVWSAFIFKETITITMIIGVLIILAGVLVIVGDTHE